MPELDTVRACAVLLVMFSHSFMWAYPSEGLGRVAHVLVTLARPGWLGVQAFFVLSGFLITTILFGQRTRPDYYTRFYVRRALRILPAYFLTLAILAATGRASAAYLALCTLFLANSTPLFGVAAAYMPLWSLAVEEHFYLVWPVVMRRFGGRARTIAFTAVGISVTSALLRGIAFRLDLRSGIHEYTWFTVDGLATGTLLAVFVRARNTDRTFATRVFMAAVAVGTVAGVVGLPYGILTSQTMTGALFQFPVFNCIFFGLIGLTLVVGTGDHPGLVTPRPLRLVGEASYGVYLYHVLVFWAWDALTNRYYPRLGPVGSRAHVAYMLARFVGSASITIALAFISRRTFEEYFLRQKERWTPGSSPERSHALISGPGALRDVRP